MDRKIIIIGSGPTGLGAAWKLEKEGINDYLILEREGHSGGLSTSFSDEKGFTWDLGGHVIFSHYQEFDSFIEESIKNNYLEHIRESWVWKSDKWIPYPFQNNIRYLPPQEILECLMGLVKIEKNRGINDKNSSFDKGLVNFFDWIKNTFGEGIAKHFMNPYNDKVWAHPLSNMSAKWIAERVSIIDLERVLSNVIMGKDDVSWGPNSIFKFPLYGGTGGIFKPFAEKLGDKLQYNSKVIGVDLEEKTITCSNGQKLSYEYLISTMPLDQLLSISKPKNDALCDIASKNLISNSGIIVGLGLKAQCPSKKCWMYFPQNDSPFYRVTYFSNYSPNNVPDLNYYSLMCEISVPKESFDSITTNSRRGGGDNDGANPLCWPGGKDIVESTIEGLLSSKMISEDDVKKIVTKWVAILPESYPIPSRCRDMALMKAQPFLMEKGVFSRGRFGGWCYEVGNMDHSFMQGFEVAERILTGKSEKTYPFSSVGEK